ncbi:MAG: ABC transporter substrate-binding protein [Raoultibacter sp.]
MRELKRLRITRGFLVLFLAAVVGLGLVACSSAPKSEETKGQPQAAQSEDKMADRSISDDAGRSVSIPGIDALKKIYYTGATGQIMCFTLAPELAGGSTMEFTPAELKYLPQGTKDLPYLGTLSGGKELNPEAIMAADIQLIFSLTMAAPSESDISQADDLQKQTGIPVVVLDGSLTKTSDTYKTLGTLLGKEDEAAKLAAYCENALSKVEAAVATVPADKRVSLYYAEGPEGLQTEPEASPHALSYKLAGAKNVADGVEVGKGKGMSPVSLEQVLAWNPEVIIAWDDVVRGGGDELIRSDPNWSTIKAVEAGRVYTMPNVPFAWCDRPPSVNRFLGIQWVANMLYPQAYAVDMVDVTKEFYSTFYHSEISDTQAKELLGNSYTK